MPTADLEHTARVGTDDRLPQRLLRVVAVVLAPDRLACLEAVLVRVLEANDLGVVQVPHEAFLATNTELPRRASNGSGISSGRFAAYGDMAIDAST